MGILPNAACPSPLPAYRTQESHPPTTGEHQPPAQGQSPTPAGARSTLPAQGQIPLPAQGTASEGVRGQWDYTFHTLNINSWSTFKAKLDDVNFASIVGDAAVLLLQEHKLTIPGLHRQRRAVLRE